MKNCSSSRVIKEMQIELAPGISIFSYRLENTWEFVLKTLEELIPFIHALFIVKILMSVTVIIKTQICKCKITHCQTLHMPSTEKWLNKSGIPNRKYLKRATPWTILENITLNERSWLKRPNGAVLVPRVGSGEGMGWVGCLLRWWRFPKIVVMVAHIYKYTKKH